MLPARYVRSFQNKHLQFTWFFLEIAMLWFRHNEITVYTLGIILRFMTYVLAFPWYGGYFPRQYLSVGRLIYYLSHTCKHSWPAQMIFSVISNFLLHCKDLYVFRQLTLIDNGKIYLLPFPQFQGLSWPTGWMNHVPHLIFTHCIVFSFHVNLFHML